MSQYFYKMLQELVQPFDLVSSLAHFGKPANSLLYFLCHRSIKTLFQGIAIQNLVLSRSDHFSYWWHYFNSYFSWETDGETGTIMVIDPGFKRLAALISLPDHISSFFFFCLHSFTQQILPEYLLYVRHWGCIEGFIGLCNNRSYLFRAAEKTKKIKRVQI